MRYFYDRANDSLHLTLADRKYGHSVEAAPGVVLDFDITGRVCGLDLEHAIKTIDMADLTLHAEPSRSEIAETRINGAEIKRQREALGLSQTQLGRCLAVAPNTIARWERGELKIEHPRMLSLALNALSQRNGGLPQHMRASPTKRAQVSGLVKRKGRSAQAKLTRTPPQSQSLVRRAKRK